MDIVCFCHLRWDFVYQRPQHLLSRFAKTYRVFVIEEPVFSDQKPFLSVDAKDEQLFILTPNLNHGEDQNEIIAQQQKLLFVYFQSSGLRDYILWYYTPMAMPLASALPPPLLTVYDCMDELSAFKFAPPDIKEKESRLIEAADIMFTGGYSLFEAKKNAHNNIHAFPSSIDKEHFGKARMLTNFPAEYSKIPSPRIGFFGVVDERFDIELLRNLSAARPDWHFVIIGPVVKIDPAILPVADNIHYPGCRSYNELPEHLAAWDVALIPFAINESTAFISPTKTPEYLAGGKPVVSTPIRDVIMPYAEKKLVYIGSGAADFEKGIEWGLQIRDDPGWKKDVDDFLAGISWDITWNHMMDLIREVLDSKQVLNLLKKPNEYV